MRAACLFFSVALSGCYGVHEIPTDAGPPRDTGSAVSCATESIPAFAGPPCSDAVNACRDACAPSDETCRDACLDDACRQCRYQTLFHCANAAGCQALWGSFACCIESVPSCSTLRGFARAGCATSCPMQFAPYAQCIETTGGMPCFEQVAATCGLRSP